MDATRRPFDIIVFGATGFTGRLVVEYLAGSADAGVRWAIAGRSRDKLEALGAGVPIVVADVDDPAALDALVAQTRVVCTTVGPYRRYGVELVRACARHGTHYCDITGEIPFIRMSIDENHDAAQRSGARIVHACGFDSIPSDVGTLILADHARRVLREPLAWAGMYIAFEGRGAPGGVESAIALFEDARTDRALRRLAANPGALDPEPARHARDQLGVRFDRALGAWTAPFIMAMVNTRVVRRSAALLDYGPAFRYEESASTGTGVAGLARAVGVAGQLAAFAALLAVPRLHGVLRRFVHAPPNAGGRYDITILARTVSGVPLSLRLAGTGDPGHGPTAMMLAESALLLATDDGPPAGGVLTPAQGLGMPLVPRLRRGGMTIELDAPAAPAANVGETRQTRAGA